MYVTAAILVAIGAAWISMVLALACLAGALAVLLDARLSVRGLQGTVTIESALTTVALAGLVIAWWRPLPGAGVGVASVLVALLAWFSFSRAIEAGGQRQTRMASAQLSTSADAFVVAGGLAAYTFAAASWPPSTGTFDGRSEGIAAVAAVALVVFLATPRTRSTGAFPRWPLVAAYIVAVGALGWSDLQRHPELAIAGALIGGFVLAGGALVRRGPLHPTNEIGLRALTLRPIVEASLIGLAVLTGLALDWGLRAPR